jgi:hypothetical protein
MVPPQGEVAAGVAVDMARSPAAVAFLMKGHMALDWRRTESMVAVGRPDSNVAMCCFLGSSTGFVQQMLRRGRGSVQFSASRARKKRIPFLKVAKKSKRERGKP